MRLFYENNVFFEDEIKEALKDENLGDLFYYYNELLAQNQLDQANRLFSKIEKLYD